MRRTRPECGLQLSVKVKIGRANPHNTSKGRLMLRAAYLPNTEADRTCYAYPNQIEGCVEAIVRCRR